MATPDERLAALGVDLPPKKGPAGVYRPLLVVGSSLYASGHGPLRSDDTWITGKVGQDLDVAEGAKAARQVALSMLANIKAEFGTLNKTTRNKRNIKRLVKTLGMVNCNGDFQDHVQVINGFSELMRSVFGDDCGVGVRSAVGMGSLPQGIAVEVECMFELADA